MTKIKMLYCPKNCRFLDPTEEQQQSGDKRVHWCRFWDKRLFHLNSHPQIYRCAACVTYTKHAKEFKYE